MPLDRSQVELIAFDYGNTLIPFGPEESMALGAALHGDLEALFGPVSAEEVMRLGLEARMAPYVGESPTLREHVYEALLAESVGQLYGGAPELGKIEELQARQREHFFRVVAVEAQVHEILAELAGRYRLALLSNYPDDQAIRGSLERLGLARHFEHIVVSAEIGYVKPHPVAFAYVLAPFRLSAQRACYVGDNWLCDVQGAKRVGMQAVHMRRWEVIDRHEEQPGDHAPDHVIGRLEELLEVL